MKAFFNRLRKDGEFRKAMTAGALAVAVIVGLVFVVAGASRAQQKRYARQAAMAAIAEVMAADGEVNAPESWTLETMLAALTEGTRTDPRELYEHFLDRYTQLKTPAGHLSIRRELSLLRGDAELTELVVNGAEIAARADGDISQDELKVMVAQRTVLGLPANP